MKRSILTLIALSSTSALAENAEKVGTAAHGVARQADEHVAHVANWWGMGEQFADKPALGWLTITFLIFSAILVGAIRKPLATYLETRADTVERAIAEATRARADAERRAREAEAKLAALDGEVRAMKADFETQGKAEAERIEKTATEMSAKIAKDAEDTINAEISAPANSCARRPASSRCSSQKSASKQCSPTPTTPVSRSP